MPRLKQSINSNDVARSILAAAMVRNGMNNKGMMRMLNLKDSSYYRKKRDVGLFRIHEIRALQKNLGLSDDEVMQIVLCRLVVRK